MASRRSRAVLLVSGACFALLALAVVVLGAPPGDTALREAMLRLAGGPAVTAMRVVNWAGSWRVLLPATLLLFLVFPRARSRWYLWASLMIAAPITEWVLKNLTGRPRPEDVSLSFPSGHATAAAAFFGAICYLAGALPPPARRLVRAAAIAMIVLVALARVILRAHWPSDAVAGIALGTALASAAALLDGRERPGHAGGFGTIGP